MTEIGSCGRGLSPVAARAYGSFKNTCRIRHKKATPRHGGMAFSRVESVTSFPSP